MFKSRSGSPGNTAKPPPQSIEAVRRRARHRLIGASVLVLLGVVGFPVLFDTQPRPVAVDIPIEIPSRNQPVALPAPRQADTAATAPQEPPAPEVGSAASSGDRLSAEESLSAREEMLVESTPRAASPTVSAPPAPSAPTPSPTPAPVAPPVVAAAPAAEPAPAAAASEAARARAILEGKPVSQTPEAAERIVVQVGAFADAARAREVRLKVERAGLKTYTHVAQTAEGSRIRVRVGPFATRAEADKAAEKVKALGLPAAILTL
jgi:DedD protein